MRWPGEGNVSRVETAALEWECSAIHAVASGFREYFEQQDCSPARWLQVRTKYLAFADWEEILNPARKIVPDVLQTLKFEMTDFPSITDDIFGITIFPAFR